MVDEVITKQELIDAQKDAQSLDDFINGGDEQIVVTRLLKEYPTLANAIRQIYEKGGKFYPTLAEANADIANIRTDVYVITGDNGAYYKATAGATTLTKSAYDPLTQAKVYTDAAEANTKAYVDEKIKIILDDPEYILCISDSGSNLLFAITRQGEVIGDFKILFENISDLPNILTLKDNAKGELYEIADPKGNTLARVEPDGTWVLPAIRITSSDNTEITGGTSTSTVLTLEENVEGELYKIADPQGNVLAQVEPDGTWVLPAIRTTTLDSTEITGGNSALANLTLKETVEGELYEIADPQGNILARVEPDGTWVLPAIRTTTLDSTEITGGNLNLGGSTEAEITKEKLIRISEQKYLRLDLNFISLPTDISDARLSTTGTCVISDSSKNIVYARANAEMSVQGHGTSFDKKKNYTIDFYNIDGDDLELKFGNTIASSSYHLKGFYRDPTHMRDQGGYRCWKELVQKLDYPYSKINNIVYSASPSRPKDAEFTADAKYYPHGFPVEVHLNGNFYGLYTLRLKKTRTNYALNNANTDHIFLDSGTYTAYLSEPFDATDWEIKSPKMKGYNDLGPIPTAFTETVGASCTRLFDFTRTLSTSYVNHADYIVLPHWVLWYLMCELTGDWDHNGNNYNIITWNNRQWSIIPYDLDWTLNWNADGFGNTRSTNMLSSDIWTTFRTVFDPEIKALWTKYRKNGDITVENIVKHYRGAVGDIPRDVYKADKNQWGSFPSFENVNYPDLEQVYRWFEARIAYLDSKYLIV